MFCVYGARQSTEQVCTILSSTPTGIGAAGVDPDRWNRIFSISSLRLGDVCSCVLLGSHRLLSDHLHDDDLHQDPAGAMDHGGKYTPSLLFQGLCFNGSAFVLYLIAAIVDASSVTKDLDNHNYNSWAASSFFAFVVTSCYAGNTYFSFISWRSRTLQ
ncbi:hypothetical protein DUI87_18424 [Hirundo rustica rustica]|uniref:MARVEL domain-containing protein n=1 Tax=Hirundo rustica rustica TaxID=333673 RepID=A0A3M0K1V2_HIRRU|nr:hypothetical protein DUI87_18424 [Hirundo rustica rustica]